MCGVAAGAAFHTGMHAELCLMIVEQHSTSAPVLLICCPHHDLPQQD